MSAFDWLVCDIWERENMERVEFMRESDDTYFEGQLFRHDIKACSKSFTLVLLHIILTIYVDDTAVVFTSREQLCKGLPLIQKAFADLGLEMHIGKEVEKVDEETGEPKVVRKASKTECVVRGLGKTGSVFTPAQRPFKADSGLCSLLQWYVKFNAKYLTASSL